MLFWNCFLDDLIQFYSALKGTPLDLLEMYCQSSVYMTAKWILKDCPNTPQKLTELMVQAMPEELRNIFNKLDILE